MAENDKTKSTAKHKSRPAAQGGPAEAATEPTSGLRFRVAGLAQKKPTRFTFAPDSAARAAIAADLGLIDLPLLQVKGELRPVGRHDFELSAELTATAVQPSALTLTPVSTEIRETVFRRYLADFAYPEGEEAEMPEDDSSEPLPETIDISAVSAEALALALPLYPRAADESLGEAVFAAPGVAPMREEDLKPFAGLAALADKLRKAEDQQ